MKKERKANRIGEISTSDLLCGTHFAFARIKQIKRERSAVLITDETLAHLYQSELTDLSLPVLTIPIGEKGKTREVKERVENELFTLGLGKDGLIIGFGGGVVSDLSGFVAATFCRGVDHIQIPTSIIGTVDAAIGGKTGLNTPYGKNTVGAVHFPLEVLLDTQFLSTLPDEEWRWGAVEMIKIGLAASPSLLLSLYEKALSWNSRSPTTALELLFASASLKMDVVEKDPFEKKGYRRILNLGHTLAHALERLSGYTLPHGQAVAIGLLVEGKIGKEMGLIDSRVIETIETLFSLYEIDCSLPFTVDLETLTQALSGDKKGSKGIPRFTLLKGIGEVASFEGAYCTFVERELLSKAVLWINEKVRKNVYA